MIVGGSWCYDSASTEHNVKTEDFISPFFSGVRLGIVPSSGFDITLTTINHVVKATCDLIVLLGEK